MIRTASVMERNIPAIRGNILSDNGSLLATSLPKYRLGFDANVADNGANKRNLRLFKAKVDSMCLGLSTIFKDKSPNYFKKKIMEARNTWLEQSADDIAKKKPRQHPFIILGDRNISFEEKKCWPKYHWLKKINIKVAW